MHYLKSGYVIQLIAFRWDKACIRSSPDPSLSCGSGSGLRDYLLPHRQYVDRAYMLRLHNPAQSVRRCIVSRARLSRGGVWPARHCMISCVGGAACFNYLCLPRAIKMASGGKSSPKEPVKLSDFKSVGRALIVSVLHKQSN